MHPPKLQGQNDLFTWHILGKNREWWWSWAGGRGGWVASRAREGRVIIRLYVPDAWYRVLMTQCLSCSSSISFCDDRSSAIQNFSHSAKQNKFREGAIQDYNPAYFDLFSCHINIFYSRTRHPNNSCQNLRGIWESSARELPLRSLKLFSKQTTWKSGTVLYSALFHENLRNQSRNSPSRSPRKLSQAPRSAACRSLSLLVSSGSFSAVRNLPRAPPWWWSMTWLQSYTLAQSPWPIGEGERGGGREREDWGKGRGGTAFYFLFFFFFAFCQSWEMRNSFPEQ